MIQSVLTLSQVSSRMECIVRDHNQKQQQNKIMEICMKQECTQSNILCPLCKNLHNDHREKLVSIAEIEDEYRNAQQHNEKKLLLLINQFEQFARKQLEIMIKNMKLLINPYNVLETIILRNKQQSYQQLNEQVSELIKLIEFDNYKIKFKQFSSIEINIEMNNLANQYLSEMSNFIKQHGIYCQPIQQQSTSRNDTLINENQQQQQQNNVFPKVQGPKINDFYFLQENCGKIVKCVTTNRVINIFNEKFYLEKKDCIAYLNRSLEQSEGASLVFKINSIRMSVGIGIRKIQKQKKFNVQNIMSGMYLCLSNGYMVNNDQNKPIKNFKMVEGKKYRFTFDPSNKENKQFKLEQIENSANNITMPMNIDNAQDYRIFVLLAGEGSEIQLINE